MKKIVGRLSLKKQLKRLYVGLYLLIFCSVIIILSWSIVNYQKVHRQEYMGQLEKYSIELSNNYSKINSIVLQTFLENKTFNALSIRQSKLKEYKLTYQLSNNLKILLDNAEYISGMFIYYDNYGKFIYKMNEKMSLTEKKKLLEYNKNIVGSIDNEKIDIVQQIANKQYYIVCYEKNGIAVLGLIDLAKGLDSIEKNNEFKMKTGIIENDFVVSENNRSMYINDKKVNSLKDGVNKVSNSIIYYKAIPKTELAIYGVVKRSIWEYITITQFILLFLILSTIYPAFRIYSIIKRQILHPLENLTDKMNLIKNGNRDISFNIDSKVDEINAVQEALVSMIKEITQWKIQVYEERNSRQHAELQYLQLQLNPHFYINCLKLIQARIHLGETFQIENFLISLSTHFRYLMKSGTQLVTVESEKKFVENYFLLMKELETGNINYILLMDEDAKEMMIPMLAIQTFVENSIKYARRSVEYDLEIRIRVKYLNTEEGKFINITVQDNGKGYTKDLLDELNSKEISKNGIGISNLQKRICLLYRKEYSWYFYNNKGAVSEILLPEHSL